MHDDDDDDDDDDDGDEERKKENTLAVWQLSGSLLLECFLAPMGVLFVMKTLEGERP